MTSLMRRLIIACLCIGLLVLLVSGFFLFLIVWLFTQDRVTEDKTARQAEALISPTAPIENNYNCNSFIADLRNLSDEQAFHRVSLVGTYAQRIDDSYSGINQKSYTDRPSRVQILVSCLKNQSSTIVEATTEAQILKRRDVLRRELKILENFDTKGEISMTVISEW